MEFDKRHLNYNENIINKWQKSNQNFSLRQYRMWLENIY